MSKILVGGSSGGIMSDDVTATLADVAKGKTAVTSDSGDEVGTGTLELTGNAGTGDVLKGVTFYNNNLYTKRTGTLALTGNATAAYVLKGYTFYNTNAKSKITGTMTVNSLLSFSVSLNSGRRVLASWGNPRQASGKPYSGVYIKYSTSGYPGKGGTQIYKGAGSNTTSGATSTTYLTLPNLSTTYYLSIYPYVTCSAGEMTGNVLNATVTTGSTITQTFTSSTTYTIPAGYTKIDLFAVGAGGATQSQYSQYDEHRSGGGGGGYTVTKKGIAISDGQNLNIVIGSSIGDWGMSSFKKIQAGSSLVKRGSETLIEALGGWGSHDSDGGDGGSGGGGAGHYAGDSWDSYSNGANGGSNGSNGASVSVNDSVINPGGIGQGTTTRAWGESSGTLYAGGGGGGTGIRYANAGSGGAGGGGHGGDGNDYSTRTAGSPNTGGGAGGGGRYNSWIEPLLGGTGIILAKLY